MPFIIAIVGLTVVGLVGWIMNIVALFALMAGEVVFSGEILLRGLGLPFFPLGAVMGFL